MRVTNMRVKERNVYASLALARARVLAPARNVCACACVCQRVYFAKASPRDNYTIKVSPRRYYYYYYYYVIVINTIIVTLITDSVVIPMFTVTVMRYNTKKRSYSPYCFLPNARISETKRRTKTCSLEPGPAIFR